MSAETGRLYCFNCHEIVSGEYYTFGNHHYHASCFSCEKCKESLISGFYRRGEHLLCEKCYTVVVSHKLTKCPFCKQFVGVGKFIKALDQFWHLDCFVCRDCKRHIEKEYYNVDQKVYCKECFTTHPPSDDEEEVPLGSSTIQDPRIKSSKASSYSSSRSQSASDSA